MTQSWQIESADMQLPTGLPIRLFGQAELAQDAIQRVEVG
jgi:hypothetical protein